MVAVAAQAPSILPPRPRVPFVDTESGQLMSDSLRMLQDMFKLINGLAPTVPCTATNISNLYTLTPFSISPQVKNYFSYWSFAFVSPFTSTGLVTATIVPNNGVLGTLKVFKTNGSAQATVGDIVINLFYILYYVDTLDSGNGGFVLK